MSDTRTEQKRVALVIGGSAGIGYAIAEMLATEGFNLVLAARNQQRLQDARARLQALGTVVTEVSTDVTKADQVGTLIQRVGLEHGRLDVLVHSAGVAIRGMLGETEPRHISLQIGVDLESVILVSRLAFELLRDTAAAHGISQIVNIGSYVGRHPAPTLAAYSAAKAGGVAFTEALNREWGRLGIRCVSVCPGYVATGMLDGDTATRADGPMIEASDVSDTVKFLVGMNPRCVIPEVELLRPGLVP